VRAGAGGAARRAVAAGAAAAGAGGAAGAGRSAVPRPGPRISFLDTAGATAREKHRDGRAHKYREARHQTSWGSLKTEAERPRSVCNAIAEDRAGQLLSCRRGAQTPSRNDVLGDERGAPAPTCAAHLPPRTTGNPGDASGRFYGAVRLWLAGTRRRDRRRA